MPLKKSPSLRIKTDSYKIEVTRDSGIVDTGLASTADKEWFLDDLFAKVTDQGGLRPVLRDYVSAPEGFNILYYVGDRMYTELILRLRALPSLK